VVLGSFEGTYCVHVEGHRVRVTITRLAQVSNARNIHIVYVDARLIVNGVEKFFLKKGDL
jgi:hypothetical protein